MNKDRYEYLDMEIVSFDGEDIIVTSGPEGPADCDLHVPIAH